MCTDNILVKDQCDIGIFHLVDGNSPKLCHYKASHSFLYRGRKMLIVNTENSAKIVDFETGIVVVSDINNKKAPWKDIESIEHSKGTTVNQRVHDLGVGSELRHLLTYPNIPLWLKTILIE